MSNELLMALTAVIDLIIVLIAFRLGKQYLIIVIAVNLIMVSLSAAKAGAAFGLIASPQSIFYAAIFLGTDLITEIHGKKAGYQAVWAGFLALVLLTLLGQAVLAFAPIDSQSPIVNAIDTIFSLAPRIAVGSFVAYLIAQSTDIWLFHKIKDRTGQKWLWLRNNVSTMTSQALDTVIFFPIAFYGVMPNDVLLSIMGTAYLVKLIVACIDTPFVYLGKRIVKTQAAQSPHHQTNAEGRPHV